MDCIFISQRVEIIPSRSERRDSLDQSWHYFIRAIGFNAIPVPNALETASFLLDCFPPKGIILSGGNSPVVFGGDAPERDQIDFLLIDHAVRRKIPIFGVCRGMQSLILFFGGSLRPVSNHVAVRHKLIGENNNEVNSYHSLAPDLIPDCLEVTSTSSDGVIEEIKHKSLPIRAIMSHPERENPFSTYDIELFRRFFI